jgi:hypothetical protein
LSYDRNMDIIKSLITCSGAHQLFRFMDVKIEESPNLLTCILFQMYFILRSSFTVYQSLLPEQYSTALVSTSTLEQVDYLIGYFIYDIIYLFYRHPRSPFIIHHLIGFIMLFSMKWIGIPNEYLFHSNAICVLGEITNPILNLRTFTKGTSYYDLNMKMVGITYFLFRMIGFPAVSYPLLKHMQSKPLWFCFGSIYIMSMIWFKKIVYMILYPKKT